MLTFINLLLEGLELPRVLELSAIESAVINAQGWWNLLNPQLLFSIFFYFACSYGIFSITLKLLYRWVKKIVHYPHKKGCEFQ